MLAVASLTGGSEMTTARHTSPLIVGGVLLLAFASGPAANASTDPTPGSGIVSVSTAGTPGQQSSGVGYSNSTVSANIDGSRVFFLSWSADLTPATPTPPGPQLYERDRSAQTTTLVSLTSTGAPLNSHVGTFKTSSDGRYLAFSTSATNMGLGHDDGGGNLYLRDLQTGQVTWQRGVSSYYAVADTGQVYPDATAVTPDGRYRVLMDDTLHVVRVADAQTGVVTVASSASDGTIGNGQSMATSASISSDGREVTFFSTATNLIPGYVSPCAPNNCGGLYQKDLVTGVLTALTADLADTGTSIGQSVASDDGDQVAFCALGTHSAATVGPDYTNTSRLYVRSVSKGTTLNASFDGGRPLYSHSFDCNKAISGDGRTIIVTGNAQLMLCDDFGPAACTDPPLQVYAEPNQPSSVSDVTAPTVTGTADRAADASGWYTAPVTVTWSATDDVTTPDHLTIPSAVTVSTDGADQLVMSAPVCDEAGNCTNGKVTVSLDATAPQAAPSADRPPDDNGWYTAPVTVTFACSDATSGVGQCPDPVTVSTDGAGQVVAGEAVDVAGNTATASLHLSVASGAYPVTYDANGGAGATPPARPAVRWSESGLDAPAGSLTRTGFAFAGWNTLPGGDGVKVSSSTTYAQAAGYTLGSPVRLYAAWVPSAPTWNATTVYTAGDVVIYNGRAYTAQWWVQGQAPGFSAAGPWAEVGSYRVCQDASVQEWTSSWTYLGGESVAYGGSTWRAQWWTRDQTPGAAPWGPWVRTGSC